MRRHGGPFPEFDDAVLAGRQDHVVLGAVSCEGDDCAMRIAYVIVLGGRDFVARGRGGGGRGDARSFGNRLRCRR